MTPFLVVLHVLVSIFLIAVVLLQRGRGAEIGAVFGGGASSTVFGSRGAGNFLTKLTTASAVIFMTTSLSLSYLWTTDASDRLFDDEVLEEEAAAPAAEPLFEQVGTVPAAPQGAESAALPEDAGALEAQEAAAPETAPVEPPQAGSLIPALPKPSEGENP